MYSVEVDLRRKQKPNSKYVEERWLQSTIAEINLVLFSNIYPSRKKKKKMYIFFDMKTKVYWNVTILFCYIFLN